MSVTVLAGCASFTGSTSARTSGSTGLGARVYPAAERHVVPAIAGKTLTGTRLSLGTLTGHGLLVVNVWASWCAPCRRESRLLATLSDAWRGRGVRFVGLDEQDSAGRARAFVQRSGMTYPHLVDTDGALLAKLSVLPRAGIPSTLVIDTHGRMAARIVGPTSRAQLTRVVAEVRSDG